MKPSVKALRFINKGLRTMLKTTNVVVVAIAALAAAPVSHCLGSYHFMQIEKIVGGVNGDVTAQAIQLRMRSAGQGQMDNAKLIAWDAVGENPVVIIDFQNAVPNEAAGERILIISLPMAAYTDPAVEQNFFMEALIPESYLAAGSLTFQNDEETLLVWRASWGGTAYIGDTTGSLTNDDDREFGPPFGGPLPSSGLQVLEFAGDFDDKSSSNEADYLPSNEPGVLTNNSGDSFTLIVPDCDDPEGAGPDSDNDSVRDVCDECPDHEIKSQPGICGCGRLDTDSDSDGIPNCHDPDQGGQPPEDGNNNGNDNDSSDGGNDNSASDGSGNNINDNGSDTNDGGDDGSPRGCSPGLGAIFVGLLGLSGLRFLFAASRIRLRGEEQLPDGPAYPHLGDRP